ncbi:hypothetical protein [Kitasatospora sp. NPDC059599]|uniref:hypothetical protein n=1 Tax=Kitasatospora sp. NPDC059599 TaxID=3346880 RepID=UPI00368ADAEC
MDNDHPRADRADRAGADQAAVDHPFADGRNVLWTLDGFGTDDHLYDSRELDREEYLRIRPLLAHDPEVRLGDDIWMLAGDYRVPPRLHTPLWELLGPPGPVEGLDYFIGARQNLPDGPRDR